MRISDPDLSEVLLHYWQWHIEVILILMVGAFIFGRGWLRLRRKEGERLATGWQLALFMGGLASLGLAILSPIEGLAPVFLFMHMVQHLIFTILAPILLLSSNPVPFMMEGLPSALRRRLEQGLHQETPLGRALYRLASPGLVWILFIATLWGWHDPALYDAALRHKPLHITEHLSFFGTGLLFWWHVTGASPHVRRLSRSARLAFMVGTVVPTMGTGIFIAATNQPLYTYYTTVPRMWDVTALQDQQWGGLIMAVTGSMMFLLGTLIFVARILQAEEAETLQSRLKWDTDEELSTAS